MDSEPPAYGIVHRASRTPDSYTDSDDSNQRHKYVKHEEDVPRRALYGHNFGAVESPFPGADDEGPDDDEDYSLCDYKEEPEPEEECLAQWRYKPGAARAWVTDGGECSPWTPGARPLNPVVLPTMYLRPNKARGDCQFEALAQALNDYDGLQTEALTAHLRLYGLNLGSITGTDLRRTAYQMFLVADPELDTHLSQWKLMAGDPSLAGVYDHAAFLKSKRVDLLTLLERQQLFQILMNPHVTWGDETSLYVLERLRRVRVDVLTGHGSYLQTRDTRTTEEPLVFMCMHLSHQHYECVLIQDNAKGVMLSAWAKNEVPEVVVSLHRVHCATAVQPNIRMDDAWLQTAAEPAAAVNPFLLHFNECTRLLPPLLPSPATPRYARQDSCASVVSPTLAQELYDADGGWQHPGEMVSAVSLLQCGLRVHTLPKPPSSVIVDRLPNATTPRLF